MLDESRVVVAGFLLFVLLIAVGMAYAARFV